MPMFGRKTFDPRKLAKYNTTDRDVLDDRRQTVAHSPNLSSKLYNGYINRVDWLEG